MNPPPLLGIPGAKPPSGACPRWLHTADGTLLRAAFWPDAGARGSLIAFPGRTEFVELYYETVREARAMGLAAAVLDWRYQGLNRRPLPDPRKGHVHRFDEYLEDADAYVLAAANAGLPRPWFVFAHSMGGAVAHLHAARSPEEPPDALILLAPMLGLRLGGLNARIASAVAGAGIRLGLGESYLPGVDGRTIMDRGFRRNPLTASRQEFEMVARFHVREPRLPLGAPTWRWLHEALRATRNLRHGATLGRPLLAIVAEQDRVVDNRRTREILRREPSARIETLAGSLHCPHLERETIRREVFASVRALVDRWT